MNLEKYEVLYSLLWKEYKRACGLEWELKNEGAGDKADVNLGSKEIRRKMRILYNILHCKGKELNIFAQEEFQVTYKGGIRSIGNNIEENLKQYLNVDCVYNVKIITPYESHTIVELKEFPGVIFEASAFSNCNIEIKGIDELLKEYGPEIDKDMEEVEEIIKEYKNRPILSDMEKLRKLHDEYKSTSHRFVDAIDDTYKYIDIEKGVTTFKIGESFYDGSRNIEILAISDEFNALNNLVYFCKIDEELNKSTWFSHFDQIEMEIIKLANIKGNEIELTEKEKLIKEIMIAIGNDKWPLEESSVEDAPEQKYIVGQCIEASGKEKTIILAISPCVDCYNEWIYFYKSEYFNEDNKKICSFYTEN